jgi:hypothetical protein
VIVFEIVLSKKNNLLIYNNESPTLQAKILFGSDWIVSEWSSTTARGPKNRLKMTD